VLLLKDRKNTKKQGDVGLAIAIAWFVSAGYCVSIPLTDSQDYDLVVDFDDKLSRVQVKTTYYLRPNGVYEANLVVSGGNRSGTGKVKPFNPQRVDYLFVVTELNQKYLIPASHITSKRCIVLGEKYAQYRVH
jgi:hypothetical protein